jgi:hypothetical protein
MADSTKPNASNNISSTFLPRIYATDFNKKFLQATMDQLIKPGTVKKVNGYIGRRNAKATSGEDIFVSATDTVRQNYQLEPGLVIKDTLNNTTLFKDYIDYINQLDVFGSDVSNHSRINKEEFYSWDPHIDWDKISNFQNYYWLPYGPDVVRIYGQKHAIESTYTVNIESEGDNNTYIFTPNGLDRNPVLTLFKGQTYNFEITSPGNPFSFKTHRSSGSSNRYTNIGLKNNTIETGTITFTVPHDAPSVLYYQSENDTDLGGVIHILSIEENSYINVETEILGKKTYKLPDGTPLSNGMKVTFGGNVEPSEYSTGKYYVEGIGSSIRLVNESVLEMTSSYTSSVNVEFDTTPFDKLPFNDALSYAGQPDYIVINRASRDHNPWSRYNRWFHKDTIESSARFNNKIADLDQSARANRAIIEFEADIRLFNFGTTAINDVDLIDTYTTDIFSTIEGSHGYNIDGVDLLAGHRILAAADTDPLVKNKIYEVEILDFEHLSLNGVSLSKIIHLVEVSTPTIDQVVLIHSGVKNQGEMYWFNGDNWVKTQQKTSLNQPPLFDVVDDTGVSYSDINTFTGSTFSGTKLFSYKIGSGPADSVLGFPLSYKNINNIGDIVFNFNLISDTFIYKELSTVINKKINVGYLSKMDYAGNTEYVNGWQKNTIDNTQAAIRIYKSTTQLNDFQIDIFDNINELDDLTIKVYVNGTRLDNSKWQIIDGPTYKVVQLDTDVMPTDILTIRAFAAQGINGNGYYEIPLNLQNNPMNDEMTDFTLGEVIDHVNSIVDNLSNFSGDFPGTSNLRDLGNISQYGTRFIQHSGPASLSLYHITTETNNIIRSIEKSRDDYGNFKRNFIKIAERTGVDIDVITHIDLILDKINKDKPNTFPYYFSDMVPYGASIKTTIQVVDYRIKLYPLTTVFTTETLSNKAVIIYVNNEQLLHSRDYYFDGQGFVVITSKLINDDIITIYEYENTDGCFVPETPTKLGLFPKYQPMIYLDTSFITPRWMIQGHDGSQVLAYGTYDANGTPDYRDALLLELEKRIYNNIKVQYDITIFDLNDTIPGYNRKTDYSLSEFNTVLAPNFYKWTSLIDRDFSKPLSFDRSNSFTYNYSGHSAPDGSNVPGYWRGVYKWILDTDRPHLCPWEMLGFTEEPYWWTDVYGPAPYTSNNFVLWDDISNGYVKEPGKPTIRLEKYAKPFITNHIPVDEYGALVSPIMSDLANGIITESIGGDFVFGDSSPIESAWRRSSYYSFGILITVLLLNPNKSIGVLLDRSRIIRNKTGQLVYKDTGLRIKPSDIVLPSIQSSNTREQTAGIINYLVNYILSDNLKSYTQYQYDLTNISARISHRLGSFTSKEKFNLLLDSKTPLSTGSVFVPQENYDIILNSSNPIKKITYSGVIVTKMADGFEVKGYSKTTPYFKYYAWQQSGITINVGGISESYLQWTSNQQYSAGKIVNYNGKYYRVKSLHTTGTTFDQSYYQVLAELPIIGGKDAILRKRWDRESALIIPYNTKFRTTQEVVDFLQGYGEYLKDQGFIFDDFNTNIASVTNWETSAKEFLFWTTQNWSTGQDKWDEWDADVLVSYGSIVRYNGDYYRAIRNSQSSIFNEHDFAKLDGLSSIGSSVISLSPAAEKLTFSSPLSVVDDITNSFNGYEIYRVDGQAIPYNFLNSYREDNAVSYTPQGDDGIYGATFYLVQKEQVVILDNSTMFNDTIYNPESGYKQDRIKVSGYLSIGWYGAFDVPGFIFDQAKIQDWEAWKDYALGDIVKYKEFYYSSSKFINGTNEFNHTLWIKLDKKPEAALLPNWNYKASQFEDFYSLDSDNFDITQQKMAQHLIGYQKRQYLENIIQDDVSEFKFYQGMILEKGTQNVLNKLFDVLSADNQESLKFNEEWAVRVGQYGASNSYENIEFILDESLFKNNPQGIELVNKIDTTSVDFIIRQSQNDVYLKPVGYNSNPWPMLTSKKPFLRTSGYVREDEVLVSLKSIDDILTQDITNFSNGDYVWCSFDINGWNVYRYTDANIVINDITYSNNKLTITADSLISLPIGSYIGIRENIKVDGTYITTGISGFYKISDVKLNVLTIDVIGLQIDLPYENNKNTIIYSFISQRVDSIDNIDLKLPKVLKENELLWTDDNGTGMWSTWEYSQVYTRTTHLYRNPSNNLKYGKVISINSDARLLATTLETGEVITYDRGSSTGPWVQRQIIETPFITPDVDHVNPNDVSNIANVIAMSIDNRWMATGSPNTSNGSYQTNGFINAIDEQLNASSIVNHGVISLYEKDINNIYTLVATILSPNPTQNEKFGSSLFFGINCLYVGAEYGNGTVYKLEYSNTEWVSAYYDEIGSKGTTIKLSTVSGILPGMKVTGIGFTKSQTVVSVDSVNKTILLNLEPDSTPTGIIKFITTEWKYNTSKTKHGTNTNSGYGNKIVGTVDGSTLLISAPGNIDLPGKVFVYENDVLAQTIGGTNAYFGKDITISSSGEYISISDILFDGDKNNEGKVIVYKNNGIEYELYQSLINNNIEVSGYFGTKLLFTNDYKTLLVYSKNADTQVKCNFIDDTTFDDKTTIFIDENNLDSGRIDVYNNYGSKWVFSESLEMTDSEVDGYGTVLTASNNNILVSSPYAFSNNIKAGVIYEYKKQPNVYSWKIKHSEILIPDVKKIKQAFLYNKSTNELIKYLDIIDPLNGKIAGIAESEIKYKVFYDPAIYTVGTSTVNVDDGMAWTTKNIGTLWWDLRTSKFIDSNDNDVVYRNSTWSTLATGASVDIYEWVESKYLPSDWDLQADTEVGLTIGMSGKSLYGDAAYSIKRKYDNVSKTFKNTYYYWVKNKKTTPNTTGRYISAQDISSLISNPRGEGYQYLALTGSNSFSLVNVKSLLNDKNVVLSVEYWLVENSENNIHSQWKMLSTDVNSTIPSQLEKKWIDSLCGKDEQERVIPDTTLPLKLRYGVEFRPNQSMFINRYEALKQYVEQTNLILKSRLITETRDISNLESYETEPHIIRGLYDDIVDTDAELRFANINSYSRPVIEPQIIDGRITGITIKSSGRGYINPPFIEVVGSGVNAVIKAKLNGYGQIDGVTIINSGYGYNDSTILVVRDYSVLVHSDSQSSGVWSIYSYDPTTLLWSRVRSQTYDTRKYWNYVDWYDNGYNQFSAIQYSVDTYSDLNSIEVNIGELVKVRYTNLGTWVVLKKYADSQSIDWTSSYQLIASQDGTIQLSSSLYEFSHTIVGYDNLLYDGGIFDNSASTELRVILNSIKNDIFIDDLKTEYLNLFFTCVRYVLSEQSYVDWIFKTSFIKAKHNLGELHQSVTYKNDNLTNFEEYVSEVKPYRTKVREYISAYNKTELNQLSVTDFDIPPIYDNGNIGMIETTVTDGIINIDDSHIQSYPWKHWLDNVGFNVLSITVVNGGSGYISEPVVRINGNSKIAATAKAFIANGKVTRVILMTTGSGYLSAPIIQLDGGLSPTGTTATAVAIIGDGVIRSNLVKIKFDRITQSYYITKLQEIETFSGTGSRLIFPLKWAPDVRVGTSTVTINGIDALRDDYKLKIVKTVVNGHTNYVGSLTFLTAPSNNAIVSITYIKDWSLLNAADRIQYYYNPGDGELGKDLSQLMTGIDYGGVIVSGLGFEVSRGWDSSPYYSDKWDTMDSTFDDYIVYVAADTREFNLPYVPETGVVITVYHKPADSTDDPLRIDDQYYNTVDQTNSNAVMSSFIGDGIHKTITIPDSVDVNENDEFIFRKITSDGSIKPLEADYDTALSGGDLVYSTARGLAADDIIIDGDGFITPTSSPAPEEVIPGQVVDTVAIKVFDMQSNGSANINIDNYYADGIVKTFPITHGSTNNKSIIVKVSTNNQSVIKSIGVDYSIDGITNAIVFGQAPVADSLISIFEIGYSGNNLLDIGHDIGDGNTKEFLTRAPWLQPVSSLVNINGVSGSYTLINQDGFIAIKFDEAPEVYSNIDYIISNGVNQSFSFSKIEKIPVDGRASSLPYSLMTTYGDSLPLEAKMIVRVDQAILKAPNNSYFTIKSNKLNYTVNKINKQPYKDDVYTINVYAGGKLLTIGADYSIDLSGITVKITKDSYTKYNGEQLVISLISDQGYSYVPATSSEPAKIYFKEIYNSSNTVEIINSYQHANLDIQRSDLNLDITLVSEEPEYYIYNNILGGIITLDRPVINDNYVWVVKNGILLIPSVDFKLNENKSSIEVVNGSISTDEFSIITFGSNILLPSIAYMQFKDMLNRTHYKRLSLKKQTTLVNELKWNDTIITVVDGSNFDKPNPTNNKPGIIEIRGERIEYFEITGNILSKLRRGTLGTGTPTIHEVGSFVQDIGASETIPYSEAPITKQIVSTGSKVIELDDIIPTKSLTTWTYDSGYISSIPSTYGQADDIEVFIGGYDDSSMWVSSVNYAIDDIVIIGSYTYRCKEAHMSGLSFHDDILKWDFFIGNIRLKKQPYKVHNVNINQDSPSGDIQFDADFAVDGTSSTIRLTNELSSGTRVTIVKRSGINWDGYNMDLLNQGYRLGNYSSSVYGGSDAISTFLKAEPGIWYSLLK